MDTQQIEEKRDLRSRELFFILFLTWAGFRGASFPKAAFLAAGRGAWVSLILVAAVVSVGVFCYASLNKMFAGMTIVQYAPILLGKAGAKLLLAMLGIYFYFCMLVNLRGFVQLINVSYLPLTPIWALVSLFGGCVFYIAYKGVANIARLGLLICTLYLLIACLHYAYLFIQSDAKNIMPLFEPAKIKQYVKGSAALFTPFLGFEILAFLPFRKDNAQGAFKASFFALVAILMFYIYVYETVLSVLGPTIVYNDAAIIESMRIIPFAKTVLLERADILFLTVGVGAAVMCLTVLSNISVDIALNLMPHLHRTRLFMEAGIAAIVLCTIVLSAESAKWLIKNVLPYFGLATALGIPLLLYCLSKIKRASVKQS